MNKLPFFASCVDWPREKLPVLQYLIDEGTKISRETFMRKVDFVAGRDDVYYPRAADYHVSYWTLPDLPVCWYVHSAIEFVYATEATIEKVRQRASVAA